MILKSFILGNLVSLCMKIINSVVVVGLYYGFLTTFSMGPSYLFLLRARVIEEGEEGTEKKISATTGFITGQLLMFISIYYAPLHLALGRPHTITVLALPYLLFHFFWNNHKHFFDYGSTTRNSMRNLSIQCVFLNNLIFQLFNHFILPSSMLVRLVNIYMFRCNNKMLFVTSSFVGWLIGHMLFMKWVGLILVWIQQNNSLRSNVLIRSNKYLVSELRNSMARIFSILLFITCVYSLGRIPSPIFTKKLKETPESEESEESEEETDVEIETTSETKGTKKEQGGSTEEEESSSPFSEEKEDPDKIDEPEKIRVNGKEKEKTKDEFHFHFQETCYKNRPFYETFYLDGNQENSKLEILLDNKDKDKFWFEKPLVTILFDSKRWNCPFRYIKNDEFKNAVKKEMSQYFFYTCQSDGKERISFTYPPSLSTFFEIIQRKMSLFTIEKLASDELYNNWNFNNEQKKKNLSNEFRNRVEAGSLALNTLEKRTRLCNDKTKKEYLPKIYDPLLNGPYRARVKCFFSSSIINEISIKNYIGMLWINKIHLILLFTNFHFQEFEQKIDTFNQKSFLTKISYFLHLINEFDHKDEKMDLENQIKILKYLFDGVITDYNNKTMQSIAIKEINKKIPLWSYKLISELKQQKSEKKENAAKDHEIRSRKAKRVVIFTNNHQNTDTYNKNNSKAKDTTNSDQTKEMALIRYSQQSDFRRNIIKGSMRTQRRKTTIWKLFQANVHSPLFLERLDKFLLFSFDISELMKIVFRNWICKNTEFAISDYTYTEDKTKENEKKEENQTKREKDKREEKVRVELAETWDNIFFAQIIRGSLLVIQSILRKYILLPSLIIAKNTIRMLFFQLPEWSEDLKDWKREMHVKCTYNGVQLSETEFPKNWLTDGIQIKILFPFRLKPWHKSKLKFLHKNEMKKKRQKNDFCFLTVFGMETEFPFGSPKKGLSPFEPIFQKFRKQIIKFQKNSFLGLTILKEKINKLSKSKSPLFGFREIYELNETKNEKDSTTVTQTSHKRSIPTMDWINHSLKKKKMKDLNVRTKTIRNQIEKITKEKRKGVIISKINISRNKLSSNAKSLKSLKNISRILQRSNAQLVHKSSFFTKILIERIYINIFLVIIKILRINIQFFFESTRKTINKYIYNNKENPKRIDKTNKNQIHFISIIKKSFNYSNGSLINNNLHIFSDTASLSQAYVFFKLSQTQVINLYKLRFVLQYHKAFPFLKNEIKGYFGAQGLFQSKLKDTNFSFINSVMNQWKNWLKSHYQYKYNLSQIYWYKLMPQKRQIRINERGIVQKKDLNKWNLYKKDQVIHYEKQKSFEVDSLPNQKRKEKFQKYYKFNLFSYQFINSEDKKDSSIYGLPLQVNNKQEISSNYKTNKKKSKVFDMLGGISINNYLGKDDIINMEKNPDRKYFDWRIFHFCLRKKANIESWINTRTKNNTKTVNNLHQIIDKFDNKDLFFLTICPNQEVNSSNKKKKPFDWMGMNDDDEILKNPISNLELERWFFPKFVILYNVYKKKPWAVPINLLLFNFKLNENANVSHNKKKKINGKNNKNIFISLSSNEKKSIELENRNHEQKESKDQADLRSIFANREKDVKEEYVGSDMKKGKSKRNKEAKLNFFKKRYLGFQLRWDGSLNKKLINNIKVYCLLLRLANPREIFISSIQRGELSLDILTIQKNLIFTELIKGGILIIEPTRLSVKNDGKSIMYQTISPLLIHKSKQQINQRYREQNFVDKKNLDESTIERHQKITGNGDKNDYDLFVLENLLSPKHRRELRILISLNSKNKKDININAKNFNDTSVKSCDHIVDKSKHFDSDNKDRNKLIKLKLFLWPNYRLEDLACINRYWFDTNNASRFSIIRIQIYPRLKIQ
uniref:Ycf1 protein n=1 Tax=Viola betonicifolia TaxID=1168213 RepID=UPI002114E013|nr:Ycf1 protein [Viola betonicifolia]UTC33657.1 Ycf1 protein [Viola betonicifolia]UXO95085.1 Ycf1 protein [Viola betonicifolia]